MIEIDNGLADRLSALARDLHEQDSLTETLEAITAAAIGTVPGAELSGLMVIRRRELETRAVTDELVRQIDKLQYDTGQGPCLDATGDEVVVRLPDTGADRRWPDFSRQAATLGVGSMLSFQLAIGSGTLGALNLYAGPVGAFDQRSEHIGELFATHAAIAMADAQQREQLIGAVATRDLIGQAKGILMERHKLTTEQAFGLLVRVSQETNSKLIDIAAQLTRTGRLPSRPTQHT